MGDYLRSELLDRVSGSEVSFLTRTAVLDRKTQAYSIYRKLGVSSRSEAVTRTRELGLIEADVQLQRDHRRG